MKKHLLVITGPTCVGKTKLSIYLAKKFNTEIISADSRQFYRELNIGVAKPSAEELKAARHHFINSLSIYDKYNAGIYEKEVLSCLQKIFQSVDVAILTGGSGLFINAVCSGFDPLPSSEPLIRDDLNNKLLNEGIESLCKQLKKLDPVYYAEVDLANHRRIIRAIEVCLVTGTPYSNFRNKMKSPRNFSTHMIGLTLPRNILYHQIEMRVDKMFETGLIDEVKSLQKVKNLIPLQAIGYKEVFDYLENKMDRDEITTLIKRKTKNYAKRQLTWFRKDKEIEWFSPYDTIKIVEWINKKLK